MDDSLHQDILYLEERLQSLNDRLTNAETDVDREQIMERIRAIELALQDRRKAQALQQLLHADIDNHQFPHTESMELSKWYSSVESPEHTLRHRTP